MNPAEQLHGVQVEQKKEKYNFSEIAGIEPAMVDLVTKLKDKIESGIYDAIISDEVGGRIPSLVLKKIFQKKFPQKKMTIYFVRGGHEILDMPAEIKRIYMKPFGEKVKGKMKKALLATEYIASGDSIMHMKNVLKLYGIKNIDIASLYYEPDITPLDSLSLRAGESDLIIGRGIEGKKSPIYKFYENSSKLGGVEKEGFTWYPEKLEKMKDLHKNEVYAEEEKKQIRGDIKKARQDVNTLVNKVIEQVWGT